MAAVSTDRQPDHLPKAHVNCKAHHEELDESLVSGRVQELVKDLAEEKGLSAVEVKIEAGSLKGDNYLGVIAKATVSGVDKDGAEVVLNLIVKSAPKQEAFRNVAPIRLAYEREIYMYTEILPKFIEFQAEHGVKNPFNSIAKCLKTTFKDKDEALIMCDMKCEGYGLADRLKPLSIQHVSLVIKELAKLHAVSFAMKDQQPQLVGVYAEELKRNFMDCMDTELFEKHSEVQYDKIEALFHAPEYATLLPKFKDFRKGLIADFKRVISPEEGGKAGIIRHGDCWTNNFLFAYKDEANPNHPTHICFLDWQLSHYASPVLDLLYILFSCTDKELRDAHYDKLMRMYFETAKDYTKQMGTNIEKFFTYEDLQEHLKRLGRYGLMMAIMIIPLISSDSDEVPDFGELLEINGQDFTDALNFKSRNSEIIDKRIREVVFDMVEKEYI